ncbi:MAG: O-antigen ligase family protein, partial [Candidatus Roizmanbacteria bacterium]
LCYHQDIKKLIRKNITIVLFIIALGGVSISIAHLPYLALYKWLKLVEIILVFGLFSKTSLNKSLLLKTLLASTLIQIGLVFCQLYLQSSPQGMWYYLGERLFSSATPGIAKISLLGIESIRPYGTFSHPNSLAGYFLLVFVFLMTTKFDKKDRVFYYLGLVCSAFLVLFSCSKLAVGVGMLVAVIYFSFNSGHLSLLKKFLLFIFSLLVLCFTFFVFRAFSGDPFSFSKRLDLFLFTLKDIQRHWLLGVGLGNHVDGIKAFPSRYSYFFLQPVHSIYLLLIHEVGVPIFLFCSYWFANAVNWKDKRFVACLMVVLLTGLGDHYWLTLQQNMLVMGAVLGICKSTD